MCTCTKVSTTYDSFDYGEKFWVIKYRVFTCECGSRVCRFSKEAIQRTLDMYAKKLKDEQEKKTTNEHSSQRQVQSYSDMD